MSSGGNLNCRKICHLNVGHDNANIKENIKTCLKEAENFHLKSISFPALGTGNFQPDYSNGYHWFQIEPELRNCFCQDGCQQVLIAKTCMLKPLYMMQIYNLLQPNNAGSNFGL